MRSRTFMVLPPRVVPLLGLLACAGCTETKTYTVQVDAISQPAETGREAPPQSYHILARNPRLNEDSLRYKEVTDYVRTALSGRGMYEAPTPETADVMIDVDYGMESPRIKFERLNQPIMVQRPGRYVTESHPVSRRLPDGTVQVVEVDRKIFVPGTMELRGMQEVVQPVLVYEKYLKVSARENRASSEGRPPPEVWSVNVVAEDDSQELRRYMPVLASATADYIGQNTKAEKTVTINSDDESVAFVKKGL
jgi:hypothetical protein